MSSIGLWGVTTFVTKAANGLVPKQGVLLLAMIAFVLNKYKVVATAVVTKKNVQSMRVTVRATTFFYRNGLPYGAVVSKRH